MLNWLKRLFLGQPSPPKTSTTKGPLPAASLPEPEVESQELASPTRWVLPGDEVIIADYTLSCGMFYCGSTLSGISDHVSIEPCLIHPQLKVDTDKPDREGHWMTHWPSYSEIPSGCRAAYLEWLAAGRTDPEIHIGYVFLFLYGLERRVLHDLRTATTDYTAELIQIMEEVERLMQLYHQSESFQRDAANFLEACWLLQTPQGLIHQAPPDDSIPLQLALGKMAQAHQPLSADWALVWALSINSSSLAESPCFPELKSLFRLQYQRQFEEGVILDGSGPTVQLTRTYQPASVSFGGPIEITIELPEFAGATNRLGEIQPLLEDCLKTLSSYERWLDRNPDKRGTYAAVLRLPEEITHLHDSSTVAQFRQWVRACLEEQPLRVIAAAEFRQQVGAAENKLSKPEKVTLAQFLETEQIGIEPDVRLGGKLSKATQTVVLFRLAQGATTDPSPSYAVAQLLLHFAAMVVTASGSIDAAGSAHVQQYLAWTPQLQDSERERLQAHFQWLCHNKLTLRGIKSRLAEVEADRRGAIAQFLIGVAKASGEASPETIDVLLKLYPLLGFDPQQVYGQLHSPTATLQPLEVSEGEASPTPKPPAGLDLELIQQRQTESESVSELLVDIFADESDELDEPEETTPAETALDLGLDAAHSTLLLTLAKQAQWTREELEAIATDLELLLDGALENINEIAFEQCDDALIEGDEPLEVNQDVLDELLASC